MKKSSSSLDIRFSLWYLVFGVGWFLFSGFLLDALLKDAATIRTIQTYMGWAFILVSGWAIYQVLRRGIKSREFTEQRLKESEERYQRVVETAQEGVWIIDNKGTTTFVNRRMTEMLGFGVEEMTGKSLLAFMDEADRAAGTAQLERQHQGIGEQRDFKFRRKDGTVLFALLYINPILDEEGRYAGALAMVTDVTAGKQAEAILYRSEQTLRLLVENTPAAVAIFDREMKYIVASHRYRTDYDLGDQDLVGRSHYDVFPEIPERWREVHRRCLAGAVERAEEDPFPRADGRLEWVRWEIRPWYEANNVIGGVILFSEVITQRRQAENALQKRYKEINAVYEASQRLQKLLSPELLAQEIIEVLERTLEYTYSAVLLVDQSRGVLEPFALSDQKKGGAFLQADKDYVRSKGIQIGKGITGWVAEHGESLRIGDVQADPRYLSMRDNIHSELCVPLWVQDHVIGVVNIESTEVNAYTREDQLLLETVATQIAIAVQNSRLLEELRLNGERLSDLSRSLVNAYETERRAIGRELHDQFGQMLTAIKITLDISRQLPADAADKKVIQAQEIVGDLLQRVSRLSLELRPAMLDDLGLIPALNWHVSNYQEQTGIQVEFRHRDLDDRRFASETETTTYRVVQEALTNVARHADARRVRLEVRAGGEWLEIRVEDDGVGFDPQVELSKNRGLTGMRERTQLVGGTFQIKSEPGRGTRIFIRLPLRKEST